MIQVLSRATDVLDLIARTPLTLTELSRASGLHKTTVYNILITLESLGLVARDEAKRYAIGPHLLALAEPYFRQGTLKHAAEQAAALLAAHVHEAVHVAALANRHHVVIARRGDGAALARSAASPLQRRRLYAGCSGPLLLAYLERDELDPIVRYHGLPGDEWDGLSSYAALRAALRRIRDDGFFCRATDGGQNQAVAVPVIGPDGRCWASICVSLPAGRYSGEYGRLVHQELQAAARGMADELALSLNGASPPRAPAADGAQK